MGINAYHIDAPAGEYKLTLHFAELVSNEEKEALAYNLDNTVKNEKAEERIFDVIVNGRLVLKDFNIAKKYGYLTAGYEEFKIKIPDTEGLNIQFKPVKGEPVLNAIQLKKIY